MDREIKKPTTYNEQIEKIKSHGCIISDETLCKEKLEAINYYRLVAYFLPFKADDGQYIEGTNFNRVYAIYEFDRKLRGILLSALEEVEIYLRSNFAYFHAHQYGALGYMNPESFSERHDNNKFQNTIAREIENNKQVLFVRHHLENYGGKFPIWVIIELFTFGMVSYFYNDLKTADQKALARDLYKTFPKNIISWLRCCTDLRNICAHYGRLYFRIFPAIPCGLEIADNAQRRLWGAVMALRALYPHTEKWNNEVIPPLEALFEEYREDIDLLHLAFPTNWKDQLKK